MNLCYVEGSGYDQETNTVRRGQLFVKFINQSRIIGREWWKSTTQETSDHKEFYTFVNLLDVSLGFLICRKRNEEFNYLQVDI